ncbi:Deoxyadenosine kinase [Candidatus Arthromitus sp. SFB-mouse-SU]|uniref:deoxynucleoside kinase n=1 Tax=Candidatus Arthromitus sp. SFB-mouse TaxID=49118 RepID=UPI000229681E|nr:deoxynucleoside kinase [Candidatus Arthromitus sp. SFB-mouse]EIA22891.1 Deoxyadenosine kinase [Candidatus Arthromitus sp. SFB-1]EIA24826.1 Deoxyadenosine kinase [Candidatus Arthromitus sp. SFB-2]EIA26235.1 Deoxyadenosine kinase [Candidatus Arthromitus sp. SFB-3]EIA29183.1 Deoxyadenosine kinase [Candidatus Arthromitus sp. SFB-co]EIA30408.1 Deoxyadenosine kinase [Candidatus Arthromitus sp. SFB-mouse-SU]EIA31435.1 Deoxyadenosine kinase [Candidatus Arthromitus sp. SFB-5]
MVIVVGGMIGLGKTSVSEIIAKEFNSKVFYESVEDNPILPLFYNSTDEEIKLNRYPFLLQLFFLDKRFKSIKQALTSKNNVLDRSIYEDWYFCKRNMDLGRISELEMSVYESLLNNMMEELDELPKKSPDIFIYLRGSFDTVINRIKMRGRSYEIDNKLVDYYRYIWEGYDDWMYNVYSKSSVLTIDMDNMDVVNNFEDRNNLIKIVKEKLCLD